MARGRLSAALTPLRVTQLVFVFFAVFAGLSLLHVFDPPPVVVLDLRAQSPGEAEFFYRSSREAFSPDRRVSFRVVGDAAWHRYSLRLPRSARTTAIRLDPPSGVTIDIGRIGVVSARGDHRISGASFSQAATYLNHVVLRPLPVGTAMVPVGEDPHAEVALPPDRSVLWFVALRAAVAALVALLAFPLMLERSRRILGHLRATAKRIGERGGRALSDDGVVGVPSSAVAVLAALFVAATVYISLGLNQSSIGVWESMYPAQPMAQMVDFGTAKHIRSDEWNTQTPWALNQVQRGWPVENMSIGGERAPLLAAVPVRHAIAVAQPKFLGFALFDLDRGFSWWWAYKTLGLFASFFWMLLILTRGRTFTAAAGALMVYASSFTQWWLSSNLAEILIAFALAVCGGCYLLFARRLRGMLAGVAFAFYAVTGLMLHLYPPFILPLAYLGVAILAAMVVEPGRLASLTSRWRARAVAMASFVVLVGLFVWVYGPAVAGTVDAMMATSYPGHRVATSGDMPFERLVYGWFESFRTGEARIPAGTGNASEASDYVAFAPALLLLFPLSMLVRRRYALVTGLLVYSLVTALWICVRLPHPVEEVFQLAGWSWSPPARAVIGFGLASVLSIFIAFAAIQDVPRTATSALRRAIAVIGCVALALALGLLLRRHDPDFFTVRTLSLGIAAVGAFAGALAARSNVLLGIGTLLVAIPGLQVNPLMTGLSPLLEKPVLSAARKQGSGPHDRWVVIGDFVFSQGLKARGLDVISGSQLVPNRTVASVLDPRGRSADVWNRYAHVVYASTPGAAAPTFKVNQPDLYTVELSVCGGALQQLGVDRIAYTTGVPVDDLQCLEPLESPADSGVRLFRLLAPLPIRAAQ